MDWIEDIAKSFYKIILFHDADAHKPFNAFNFNPLFMDLMFEKVHSAIVKLKDSDYSDEEILNALPTHSSIRFILAKFICAFNYLDFDEQKFKTVTEFLLKYLKMQDKGDLFALKSNLIHSKEELNSLLESAEWIEANQKNKKLLANTLLGASHFVYGLYNDFVTDFGFDVFGPYNLDDKKTFLIRSFPNLSPKEIWPKINFKYKKVEVLTVYNDFEVGIRYLGCHLESKDNHLEKLEKFAVKADGQFLTEEKLKELSDYLLKAGSEHYAEIKDFSFEEQKKVYIIQKSFQFKGLFDLAGIEWFPEEEFFERVKGKELLSHITTYNMPFDEFKEKFGFNKLRKIRGK